MHYLAVNFRRDKQVREETKIVTRTTKYWVKYATFSLIKYRNLYGKFG